MSPRMVPCPTCSGHGIVDDGDGGRICPECKGDTVIEDGDDGQPDEQEEWRDFDPEC